MARGWVHTVHRAGMWQNKLEDESFELSRHLTKKDAVAHGRAYARLRGTKHVIHNRDGTVAAQDSYRNDRFPQRR